MSFSSDLDSVLSRLDRVTKTSSGGSFAAYKARCPLHDDRHPSLIVYEREDGGVYLACLAGCDWRELRDQMLGRHNPLRDKYQPRSSKLKDNSNKPWKSSSEPHLLSHPTLGRANQEWLIRDSEGRLFGVHARWNTIDDKELRWWRNGAWRLGDATLRQAPLYRAELTPTYDPSKVVWVTEGEKAADALASCGEQVLGTVCGAACVPCRRALAVLRDFRVRLFPDNDEAGLKHMNRIAVHMKRERVSEVTIFSPETELPPGGDAADWIRQHKGAPANGFQL